MATACTFFTSRLSSSTSSSSSSSSLIRTPTSIYPQRHYAKRQLTLCKAVTDPPSFSSSSSSPILTKRSLSIFLTSTFLFSLTGKGCFDAANAAILEAEDDEELLEKVKKDRKKRIDRQVQINSAKKETGYLQELVYKLSKVGQAIESNDLPTASSVLGAKTDADWIKRANSAFSKLSSNTEEKDEVDAFNSSLASLISSVTKNDAESSKLAFVSSATAFENWIALTGLDSQLKGL